MNRLYIEFQLIDACNWDCSYCNYAYSICNSNNMFSVTKENINNLMIIKNILSRISPFCNLNLLVQGGEIGLQTSDVLDVFFNELSPFKFTVSTNGEFIKKGFHTRYSNNIKQIHHHILPDLEQSQVIYYNDKNIIPGIVSTCYNQHTIESFIHNNPELQYFDFEFPIYGKQINEDIYNQIIGCRKFILNKYPHLYDNCPANLFPLDILKKYQNGCSSCNRIITIDLSNNKLLLCSIKNRHISLPFNKDNFIRVLTSNNSYEKHNVNCDTCVRNCFSFDITSMTETVKLKNRLKHVLG